MRTLFLVAAITAIIGTTASAHAYVEAFTINRCLAARLKAVGKSTAAAAACYAKDAAKPDPIRLATCLATAGDKTLAAFAKIEEKYPVGCVTPNGEGSLRVGEVGTYAAATRTAIGAAVGTCDAAKHKCVGKYVAGIMGCYAKAASKGGLVDTAPGGCTARALAKLSDGAKSCLTKAAAANGCSNAGSQSGALAGNADAFMEAESCLLYPGGADCGPSSCPTKLHFAVDASDPAATLDLGWTGLTHQQPAAASADVTFAVSSCSANTPPCGQCNLGGPIANAGASDLRNRRCSGDGSIPCAADADCVGAGGTCRTYFGAPLPVAAGGIAFCLVSEFAGPVSGTVDVESGDAALRLALTMRVASTTGSMHVPCPRCDGDAISNDGVAGGTCAGGARTGLACDGNATLLDRPDYGTTSLDCLPSSPDSPLVAALPLGFDLTTATGGMTVTAASPLCTGGGNSLGNQCLCQTCNDANAAPCASNADCPDPAGPIGPICGGRRCLGGSNNGTPCSNRSECPGGSNCDRPGEPTKPNACYDDSSSPGPFDWRLCADTAPVGDEEGECPLAPSTWACAPSSGHAQRACARDSDCCDDAPSCVLDPETPGECVVSKRPCFLTNGLGDTLVAVGMADAFAQDTSSPTLGAVFCVAPTTDPAINAVTGLPGPARVRLPGRMQVYP